MSKEIDFLLDTNLDVAFTHLDRVTEETTVKTDDGDTDRILSLVEDVKGGVDNLDV